MKKLVTLAAMLTIAGMASVAWARQGGGGAGRAARLAARQVAANANAAAAVNPGAGASKASEVRGVVSKVEDGKITVTVEKKGASSEVVVTTGEKTVVMIPKVGEAAVKDVTGGMAIDAKVYDGVAVWIDARTTKVGKGGGGRGGGLVKPTPAEAGNAAATPGAGAGPGDAGKGAGGDAAPAPKG